MKVIIAGGRDFNDYGAVCDAVERSGWEPTEILSGGQRGADMLGERWAKERGIPYRRFPAKWKDLDAPGAVVKQGRYGPYNANAGPLRNGKMAMEADALIVMPGGIGTADMIRQMRLRGKPVYEHNPPRRLTPKA